MGTVDAKTHTAPIFIHSLVTSCIDYVNSFFPGRPHKSLHNLWLEQNSATRVVIILQQLRGLPVKFRTEFDILLYTFKAICRRPPSYLSDLLHAAIPSCSLGSPSSIRLTTHLLASAPWGPERLKARLPKSGGLARSPMCNICSLPLLKSQLKRALNV